MKMKRGQEFNLGLVIVLIIALLLIIWGISFIISMKEKQEGVGETFSEGVRSIGKTFYEGKFLAYAFSDFSYFGEEDYG